MGQRKYKSGEILLDDLSMTLTQGHGSGTTKKMFVSTIKWERFVFFYW